MELPCSQGLGHALLERPYSSASLNYHARMCSTNVRFSVGGAFAFGLATPSDVMPGTSPAMTAEGGIRMGRGRIPPSPSSSRKSH